MATATPAAFRSTYLDPPAGGLATDSNLRGRVASAEYVLRQKLGEGYSLANALAYVATVPRLVTALDAAAALGGATAAIKTDFNGIAGP